MRNKQSAPRNAILFDPEPFHHPGADALEAISAWLDQHPQLLDGIAADLNAELGSARGRHGLSCETCLRGACSSTCARTPGVGWSSACGTQSRHAASRGSTRSGFWVSR